MIVQSRGISKRLSRLQRCLDCCYQWRADRLTLNTTVGHLLRKIWIASLAASLILWWGGAVFPAVAAWKQEEGPNNSGKELHWLSINNMISSTVYLFPVVLFLSVCNVPGLHTQYYTIFNSDVLYNMWLALVVILYRFPARLRQTTIPSHLILYSKVWFWFQCCIWLSFYTGLSWQCWRWWLCHNRSACALKKMKYYYVHMIQPLLRGVAWLREK